jgi:hypothetical protein
VFVLVVVLVLEGQKLGWMGSRALGIVQDQNSRAIYGRIPVGKHRAFRGRTEMAAQYFDSHAAVEN